ncbi:MAG: hypothetical protein ACUVX9_14635, partial [Anaerolineae bacterium]
NHCSRADTDAYPRTFSTPSMGRMVEVTFPSGQRWQVEYDLLGLVVRAVSSGAECIYEYNEQNLISRATVRRSDGSSSISYSYDKQGRLTSVEGEGLKLEYDYGQHGELLRIKSPLGAIQFRYQVEGQPYPVLDRVRSDRLEAQYTYDVAGRITELSYQHSKWERTRTLFYRYSYDDADNVIAIEDAEGTTRYEYDALDQLLAVVYADGARQLYVRCGRQPDEPDHGRRHHQLYLRLC